MDLISRQAAIDAVISLCDDCNTCYCGSCRINDPVDKDAKKVLEELPSAHPEIEERKEESAQNVPIEDLISRKVAIDSLDSFILDETTNLQGDSVREILESLPSAQPERKKGNWTKDCACEICGFKPWYERDIHTLSFCPNCGADMREDQDDQSK